MMFDKSLSICRPNGSWVKFGVSDAPSFAECDKMLINGFKKKGIILSREDRQCLGWLER